MHDLFEKTLCKATNTNYSVALGSGTDALIIALKSLNLSSGQRVIITANHGGYARIAAEICNLEVVYCDVNPLNGLLSLEKLQELINENIGALIVTHLYGNYAPMEKIKDICRGKNIKIIEDCAQVFSFETVDSEKYTYSDICTFSFYPTKTLGAAGDAGALVTNKLEYFTKAKQLREYGWKSKYEIAISGGINSRLDEIQACVLLNSIKFVNRDIAKRKKIVAEMGRAAINTSLTMLTKINDYDTCHLAIFVNKGNKNREFFLDHFKKYGIQTEIHYPIIDTAQSGWSHKNNAFDMPTSQYLANRVFSLPCNTTLSSKQLKRILSAIKSLGIDDE